ncbi:MAG: hypothetical protein NT033_04910, partial [Candidatus Omnitrophica bacterium]|nr:hypothetical protein [Candidatus Omnitrophota bacterium]
TLLSSKGIYNLRISYFVYRSTYGKNYKMLRVTSDRYFFDRSVRPKTKYFYMVQGFDTMGNRSQVTPAVSATTPAEKVLYSVATNS